MILIAIKSTWCNIIPFSLVDIKSITSVMYILGKLKQMFAIINT